MNLKQLSRNLGLSQTTVSRALNGYPEVNEATRQRVMAAAKQYNYRPNIRAKALATGRAMAIGHVIPLSTQHEMVNPVFADFIAGAGETYSKQGYDMLLSVVRDEDEERSYRELASKGSVDGVIVHGPRPNDPRIKLLQNMNLPFLVHGRSGDHNDDFSWLDMNNTRAFQRATQFLLDIGHERIALINGVELLDFAQRRRRGFEMTLRKAGIPCDPALVTAAEMTEANGHQAAKTMLNHPTAPTAFLVSSTISALGVQRAVQEVGLTLGRDISLITHDDDLSYLRNPGQIPLFTATRSSVRAAGKRCAEMLLQIIQTPESAPLQELWEADLTIGQSTGPAPRKL
jgi:LacI family transcriptional regulator